MGTYCLVALAVSPHYPADMGYMVPDHPTDTRTAALDVIVRWAEHLPQPGIHAALRELAMDLDAEAAFDGLGWDDARGLAQWVVMTVLTGTEIPATVDPPWSDPAAVAHSIDICRPLAHHVRTTIDGQ
ncbi:hypothetical protein D806_027780 [Mycolicibacterium smegmatis MKD8]|uniref:Uncharacterized protein n=2 Tax=Mycobacteriaceae TaxID=1762 RepID=A0A2U9PPW5_MYCSE|nr:hypothetical protein D806_027780 [Mycolicibacterium smegmatis MKD8]